MNKRIFGRIFLISAAGVFLSAVVGSGVCYMLFLSDTGETGTAGKETVFVTLSVVVVCMLAVSWLIAALLYKTILGPINDIDLDDLKTLERYSEFNPLAEKITRQNEKISRKMDEIYTEHEKQDRMRREFTANVSHELKTPLTSISGFAEIIRDGIVKDEDISRFAGNIYTEAQRLIRLVGDIIKLSQLDEQDKIEYKEPLDLYDMCEAVVASLENVASKKNVALTLSGEHSEIIGSEQIINEMICNLCDNAIKYNVSGGSVRVSVQKRENRTVLTVSDTGIGIPDEDRDRVFERFYRVNKSHSKEVGGTGLGLSIVKHGAIFHSAAVELESEVGEGTTVRIIF